MSDCRFDILVVCCLPLAAAYQERLWRGTNGEDHAGVTSMGLSVAVQMDPIQSINIAGEFDFRI